MKICAIICEFNPFHNGHKYLLKQVKTSSGCDKILCIMSGSFTQRGEICVMDKYARARHAILGGADAIIELPVSFTVAPAEIFAKGAVKILSSIPDVCTIAFGCECENKTELLSAADILLNENKNFKTVLEQSLSNGESYIKSYEKAFESCGGKNGLLTTPNNILAVEYIKAILRTNKNIGILPIKRIGAEYNDGTIKENFSSATAIRENSNSPLIKNNVPEYVLSDLNDFSEQNKRFCDYLRLILTRTSRDTLTKIYGCGEGLENRLKKFEYLPFDEIINKTTTRRYPSSRIKRILCANYLNLYRTDSETYLNAPLYIKPLAVKKLFADEILASLSKSDFKLLTCGQDKLKLNQTALTCNNADEFSYRQWLLISGNSETSKNNRISEQIKFI